MGMGSIRQHTAGRVTDFTSSICAIDDRMQFNGGGHPSCLCSYGAQGFSNFAGTKTDFASAEVHRCAGHTKVL